MTIEALVKSADVIEQVLQALEYAGPFCNTNPHGEPMLSKYDLYPSMNSPETWNDSTDQIVNDDRQFLNAILRVLNYSDGRHTLAAIASEHEYSITELIPVVDTLREKELLRRAVSDEAI